MKKLAILLILILQSTNVFSQEQSSKKQYSVMKQTIANVTFIDTIFSGVEVPINMANEESRKKLFGVYEGNETSNNGKPWVYDDIPTIATVSINGIRFESKKIVQKMSDYQILQIKKDSLYMVIYNSKIGEYTGKASYLRPHSMVYQKHENLPFDFIVFKPNTFEQIRYRCTSYSPVLDVFNTEDSISAFTKPRVMIDGRLQAKTFDYQNINLQNIKRIQVFAKGDARKYFGQKVKSGLIAVTTNESNFNLDLTLSNTRVTGEIQDSKGDWVVVSDTLLTNIEQFKNYHKNCLRSNGSVYLINGEFETEAINRKTIEMDDIINIKVADGKNVVNSYVERTGQMKETKFKVDIVASDTIMIEMKREYKYVHIPRSVPVIVTQLINMRKPYVERKTLYYVDNQEITIEQLKQYKPKELEFVESLEGCDAISKYGKRAEFGVVIYRKKKIE
jgi:hypothetical protein